MTARRAGGQAELAHFLRAMRARLTPRDVGLPDGGRRRTPGLRRQEVAQLASVSIDWYIRLEQGRVGTPGAAVLDALAQALRLSPAEVRHLHLIGRGEAPLPADERPLVGGPLRALLDGMPLLPAYVLDFRLDVLAHNAAAAALFGDDFGTEGADNVARALFLPTPIRAMQLDWARVARETVGNLRANRARHRDDPRLRDLITELRSVSVDFATWWEDHTVKERDRGTKRVLHPVVGELTVNYDALAAPGGFDQCLIAVTPADPAAERSLRALVSGHASSRTSAHVRPIVA